MFSLGGRCCLFLFGGQIMEVVEHPEIMAQQIKAMASDPTVIEQVRKKTAAQLVRCLFDLCPSACVVAVLVVKNSLTWLSGACLCVPRLDSTRFCCGSSLLEHACEFFCPRFPRTRVRLLCLVLLLAESR